MILSTLVMHILFNVHSDIGLQYQILGKMKFKNLSGYSTQFCLPKNSIAYILHITPLPNMRVHHRNKLPAFLVIKVNGKPMKPNKSIIPGQKNRKAKHIIYSWTNADMQNTEQVAMNLFWFVKISTTSLYT